MAKQIIKVELLRGGTTHEQIEWVTWGDTGTVRELRSRVAARIRDGEVFFYVRADGTRANVEHFGRHFIGTVGDGNTTDGLLSLV